MKNSTNTDNIDRISYAFNIYCHTIDMAVDIQLKKSNPQLFNNLMELNDHHLLRNLDKALEAFKEGEGK